MAQKTLYHVPVVLSLLFATVHCSEFITVTIHDGIIQGIEEKSLEGKTFYSFMGIPFAKPPVGELRFRNPVPAEPWEGVMDATKMPPSCSQFSLSEFSNDSKDVLTGQEDCLYLNVFTPQPSNLEANLPVVVFIHGGAFYIGGAEHHYPHVLLNRNIVLVVPQYRLGPSGFLSTEDSVMPGNYGMSDQVLALEWVKKNIGHFGGDPSLVTIFGSSAGAAAVSLHVLSPLSKDLFQRAIVHSGSSLAPWALARESRKYAREAGLSVGCSLEYGSQNFLSCLQKADLKKLDEYTSTTGKWGIGPLYFVPRVDGEFLPDHPANLLSQGLINDVDFLSGVTRDEGAFLTLKYHHTDHLLKDIESRFEEAMPYVLGFHEEKEPLVIARQIRDHYFGGKSTGSESRDILKVLIGDFNFNVGHDLFSAYVSRHQMRGQTYLFELDYRGELSFNDMFPEFEEGRKWVSHGDDMMYLFQGGITFSRNMTAKDDLVIRKIMLDLWTNFASTGNPTPDNSLGFKWNPAMVDSFKHLKLELPPSMDVNQRQKLRDFWTSLDLQTAKILRSHKGFKDLLKRLNSAGAKEEL